jgi:hypothetical protein
MHHCFYCGAELGCYADYHPLDTCGRLECAIGARDAYAEEREEALDELDRNNGWR